jgi:hypothetical protein
MIESRVYTQLSSNEGLTTLCRLATQLWIDSALHVLNFVGLHRLRCGKYV